jgi:hypothetical protein
LLPPSPPSLPLSLSLPISLSYSVSLWILSTLLFFSSSSHWHSIQTQTVQTTGELSLAISSHHLGDQTDTDRQYRQLFSSSKIPTSRHWHPRQTQTVQTVIQVTN